MNDRTSLPFIMKQPMGDCPGVQAAFIVTIRCSFTGMQIVKGSGANKNNRGAGPLQVDS